MRALRLPLAFCLAGTLAVPVMAYCGDPVSLHSGVTGTAPMLKSDSPVRPGAKPTKPVSHDTDEPGDGQAMGTASGVTAAPGLTADGETLTHRSAPQPGRSSGLSNGRTSRGGKPSLGPLVDANQPRNGARSAVLDTAGHTGSDQGVEEETAPSTGIGLSLRALNDSERQELNLPQGGVRVTGVGSGSALRAGFRPGDVVLSLDGVAVTDPSQFRQLMRQLPRDRPVPVLVQRPGTHLFLPLDVTPH